DYGDLGPVEASIVRRVIFFYPWVKGATKWTVHFVEEHPVQAAVATQVAKQGKQKQREALGDKLPLWASGLIPTGNGKTVNPAGLSALSTPAELAAQAAGALPGVRAPKNDVLSQLTPAPQLIVNALRGNWG